MNQYQRLVTTLAVLVILGSGSAAARQGEEARTPQPAARAYVPVDTYDFGDIYKGELISQIFIIRNEGDAELRIESLTTGVVARW